MLALAQYAKPAAHYVEVRPPAGPNLPLIQGVPLRRLPRATGLSLRYVSLIRRGERTPPPRHWQAFVDLADGWLPS